MKRKTVGRLQTLTLIALVAAFAGTATDGSAAEAQNVALAWSAVVDPVTMEPTGEEFFLDLYTGLPAEAPPSTRAHRAASGGQLIFEVDKESKDKDDQHHLNYKQRWIPPKDLVDKHFAFRGRPITINGGTLGFHSFRGQLHTVSGSYFEDIDYVARPNFFDFEKIYSLARAKIDGSIPLEAIDEKTRQRIQDNSELRLNLVEGERGFTLVSKIKVLTEEPGSRNVLVDISTGKVVSISNPTLMAFCGKDPQAGDYRVEAIQDSAGSQVPPGIFSLYTGPTYAIYAAKVTNGTDVRDYESYWQPSSPTANVPPMVAYGEGSPGCYGSHAYGILPIMMDPSTLEPVCKEWTDFNGRIVPGDAAGDALRHTNLTMQMLRSHGVIGFPNGHTLELIVDSSPGTICPTNPDAGIAAYMNDAVWSGYHEFAPQGSVVICERSIPASASLESIAHEWGHRLVSESANFFMADANSDPFLTGRSLHEGFADVVGYTLEWTHHGPYADWTFGEDINLIGRRVDVADAVWDAKLKYHKDDMSYEQDEHALGNVLPVSFMLMAHGGQNPVCSRQTLSGCDNIPVSGIGIASAFDVYYHALTENLYPTSGWDQVRIASFLAARALSGGGPGTLPKLQVSGIPGQSPLCTHYTSMMFSMVDAFAAIGYPTNTPLPCEVPN